MQWLAHGYNFNVFVVNVTYKASQGRSRKLVVLLKYFKTIKNNKLCLIRCFCWFYKSRAHIQRSGQFSLPPSVLSRYQERPWGLFVPATTLTLLRERGHNKPSNRLHSLSSARAAVDRTFQLFIILFQSFMFLFFSLSLDLLSLLIFFSFLPTIIQDSDTRQTHEHSKRRAIVMYVLIRDQFIFLWKYWTDW